MKSCAKLPSGFLRGCGALLADDAVELSEKLFPPRAGESAAAGDPMAAALAADRGAGALQCIGEVDAPGQLGIGAAGRDLRRGLRAVDADGRLGGIAEVVHHG